jgi:YesN/AraC family two-component response regulator
MSQRTSDDVVPNGERRPVYVERVNAAIDYIEAHLAAEITLSDIADVAHFSPLWIALVVTVATGGRDQRQLGI